LKAKIALEALKGQRTVFKFPAILLNFRLTVRISSEGAEMPPTTPAKPQKGAILSRAFDRRPAAEKILSRFDISSDSFALASHKSQTALTIL
jgi:hypothetical protein